MKDFKLVAATHTPFDSNGKVNLKSIDKQAGILLRNGVKTVFICGSTGEYCSLSTQERKDIAERWMEIGGDKFEIMIHVGHNSVADASELARHAQKIGAAAIAANAPCYFKPANKDDLIDYCKAIADNAVGVPFYFYHIPSITGVNFSMVEFLEKAANRIETLAGLKYTGVNNVEYHQCLNFDNKRFDIFYGCDEHLLLALSMGAQGAVGSTYNYMAPLYWKLIKAFNEDDNKTIKEAADQIFTLISIVFEFGLMPASKAIMEFLGVDCGSPRLPLKGLSPERIRHLKSRLEQTELLTLMCKSDSILV